MTPHRVIWKADNGTVVTKAFPSKEQADDFALKKPNAKVQPASEPVSQRVTIAQASLHKRRFGMFK